MKPVKKLRLLCFDLECRPGHWIGGDYVSKVITAASWQWVGEERDSRRFVLTHYEEEPKEIARQVAAAVHHADMVFGHYIRGFDLPLLNGELLRGGYAPLEPVLAQDTKLDLNKAHGRSLSQKNLAAMLHVSALKADLTLQDWEMFNARIPGYKFLGIERVRGDVQQNVELRERLLALGWLGPPQVWRGEGGKGGIYRP